MLYNDIGRIPNIGHGNTHRIALSFSPKSGFGCGNISSSLRDLP